MNEPIQPGTAMPKMYSAEQFLEHELESAEDKLPWKRRLEPRHNQSLWTREDYMDFAERYGDFVCDFEKHVDRFHKPVGTPATPDHFVQAHELLAAPAAPVEVILPQMELTESDLAKTWPNEEEREFLPAMLSCRERQLATATDREHKIRVAEAAMNERLLAALVRIAELQTSNSKLRRSNQQLSKRRAIDSHAKVWIPYWRICKRSLQEKDARIAELESEQHHLRAVQEVLGHPITSSMPTSVTAKKLVDRLAELEASLQDSAKVHINILRGEIALTQAQAIHIAGLPANIEALAKNMYEALKGLQDDVEFKWHGAHTAIAAYASSQGKQGK